MERLAKKSQGIFSLSEPVLKSEIRRTGYKQSSSLTITYLLMLCLRKPRYLDTGAEIPLINTASVSNRKDKHHIFPKALLKRNHFNTGQTNSLCNLCYIVAEENQMIGSKKPSDYFKELKHPRYFASVMKSHLIPYKTDSGIWNRNIKKGYKQFVDVRLELICKEFEKQAGMRLFKKD